MRLLFVNHAHPDIPHVSGMRLSYFAKAMAERGHQVVLVTRTNPVRSEPMQSPEDQLKRLHTHDWRMPFHLEVQPYHLRALEWTRTNFLPSWIRRALTFWYMAYHGGVFEDWVAACKPHVRELIKLFRPDLVWGTVGNTSNLVLAQFIARQAGCRWAIDIKDNWSAFIRPGLRELLAWRFRNASGYTCNATSHQTDAARWLRQSKSKVIYSGVAEAFLRPSVRNADMATRDLVLVGGTYNQVVLHRFLEGINAWLRHLAPTELANIRFMYVGSDSQQVSKALKKVDLPCRTYVPGYLPIDELASLCRHALANCYLWAPSGFHHKLLELLSCGRPVIAFPGESQESKTLAAQCDTPFSACADEYSLHAALNQAWATYGLSLGVANAAQWQWSAMAEQLEAFFNVILQERAA